MPPANDGTHAKLTARDGFTLDAYVARPAAKPRGALVVVQEIFGVNAHIRGVCDGYVERERGDGGHEPQYKKDARSEK